MTEQKHDVFSALEKVTGIPKTEQLEMFKRIQANAAAWRACKGPHALVDITPEKPAGKRYRCSSCGGECDAMARLYYEEGLRHGRGS